MQRSDFSSGLLRSQAISPQETKADRIRLEAFFRKNLNLVLLCDLESDTISANPAGQQVMARLGIHDIETLLPINHKQLMGHCLHGRLKNGSIEARIGNCIFGWTYHSFQALGVVLLQGIDITQGKRAKGELLSLVCSVLVHTGPTLQTVGNFQKGAY
ncbi:MAG: hypothetical protein F6K19_03230 [Cyanothece sp. SIO1E1]|nr:hypothetical protein [Cyanothece sp. SIO1E1]